MIQKETGKKGSGSFRTAGKTDQSLSERAGTCG